MRVDVRFMVSYANNLGLWNDDKMMLVGPLTEKKRERRGKPIEVGMLEKVFLQAGKTPWNLLMELGDIILKSLLDSRHLIHYHLTFHIPSSEE
jgi:hypothetical protein